MATIERGHVATAVCGDTGCPTFDDGSARVDRPDRCRSQFHDHQSLAKRWCNRVRPKVEINHLDLAQKIVDHFFFRARR
jgi:hypothetical protein